MSWQGQSWPGPKFWAPVPLPFPLLTELIWGGGACFPSLNQDLLLYCISLYFSLIC